MSDSLAQYLLESRGIQRDLEAFVVAACFDRAGASAAFAVGDGTLRTVAVADTSDWQTAVMHDGAVLSLAPDATALGFISGGDDGKFRRLNGDGTVSDIAGFRGKWVEHVASHPGEKGKGGLLACTVGKSIHLFDQTGEKLKELPHPSTVTGLTFDARGKRVAASHYNGATLWFVAAKTDSPRKLEWKGSHTGIAIHPDGDAVVTAMQENALHGWRLSDARDMRMGGYPAKVRCLVFLGKGALMATSGAPGVVVWPFAGANGPMGKQAAEIGFDEGSLVTRIAGTPEGPVLAAGLDDGRVWVTDLSSRRVETIKGEKGAAISALCVSDDGRRLAWGDEDGQAGVADLPAMAG